MRKSFRAASLPLLIVISLGLSLLYNNCTSNAHFTTVQGTVIAGNPMAPVSTELLFAVCGVINRCNPTVTIDQCRAGVLNASGFGGALGLVSYPTLSSLFQAEESGSLVGNQSLGGLCYDSVNNLNCTDPLAQNAYLASATDPFAGAANLVSSQSCAGSLTPATKYTCTSQVFLRGVQSLSYSPTASLAGLTYSVTPALPSGLSIDPATGTISGTPLVTSPATDYTVTASSSSGVVSTATVKLRVADGYLVNDLGDMHNSGPGCNTTSGVCTLRAAIEQIGSAPGSGNVIILPPGKITLSLGQLTVSTGTEIDGDCLNKTTVDGNAQSNVFLVTAGPTKLSNLIVQNGTSSVAAGGIQLFAQFGNFTATLDHLMISNNSYTGSAVSGGGITITNRGTAYTLTALIDSSTFENNSAPSATGGALGIEPGANVTVTNTSFNGNTATSGGAVDVGGTATIAQSFFGTNSAANYGGAVYCSRGSGSLTLTNDTISQNTAGVGGGGIASGNSGTIQLINDTVTANKAMTANGGGGIGNLTGGLSIQVTNTIIATNTAVSSLNNCNASNLVSKNNNLSDDTSCNLTATGDLQNVNPLLGPLQNYGGPTSTAALLASSPAIDHGTNLSCPATDQRGLPRPAGASCDIGAFEAQ